MHDKARHCRVDTSQYHNHLISNSETQRSNLWLKNQILESTLTSSNQFPNPQISIQILKSVPKYSNPVSLLQTYRVLEIQCQVNGILLGFSQENGIFRKLDQIYSSTLKNKAQINRPWLSSITWICRYPVRGLAESGKINTPHYMTVTAEIPFSYILHYFK